MVLTFCLADHFTKSVSKEGDKVPGGHSLGDLTVELRPFRGKAVGAVTLQFVRQDATGDEYCSAAQVLRSLSNALAQPVVIQWGESGQANAEDRTVHSSLLQKAQRNESSVVQIRVPLSQRPDLEPDGLPAADDLIPQRGVVFYPQFGLRRTESSHISGGTLAWRNVEIVSIHDLWGEVMMSTSGSQTATCFAAIL